MEKPCRYHLQQMINANITSDDISISCTLQYNILRRTEYLFCGSLLKNSSPQSNHERFSGKLNLKDTVQSNSSVHFKTIKVMKNK